MELIEEIGRLLKEEKHLEAFEVIKRNAPEDVKNVVENVFEKPEGIKNLDGIWRTLVTLVYFSYASAFTSKETDKESLVSCVVSSVNAVKLSNELGLHYLIPKYLRNAARALILMDMKDRAELFYIEAERIAEKVSDLNELAEIENDLAIFYYNQKRHREAMFKIQKALEIREKLGDEEKLAECLINAGEIYRKVGEYDLAEDCFKRAESIYRRLVNEKEYLKFDLAITLSNLGMFYKARRKYKEAERLFNETVEIFTELESRDKGFAQFVATSLRHLADLKKEMGDYREATMYYKLSEEKFKETMLDRTAL